MQEDSMQEDSMQFDVVIVGAGPAGLSAAIKLKQLNTQLSVLVLEKGSEVGAHILSGAVFEPSALEALFPDWQNMNTPVQTAVQSEDLRLYLNERRHLSIPEFFTPKPMRNSGNYIISLGNLCRWLAEQAEQLGVEIYPGFSAGQVIYNDQQQVVGVNTGAMGVDKQGNPKDNYVEPMQIYSQCLLLCEGCRGHLSKQVINKFNLQGKQDPQHYALGFKEIWQIPAQQHRLGHIEHSSGWPLKPHQASGGGFIYHIEDNKIALGLIVDLNYSNPYLNPYEEFQRFKTQHSIRTLLKNGQRLSYGARSLAKGGIQSLINMHFAGGLILGCSAGTLNAAKIKGSHCAMQSGIEAAQVVAQGINSEGLQDGLQQFSQQFEGSRTYKELHLQRNFSPAIHKWGNLFGGLYAWLDINIFAGKVPWTLHEPIPDHARLKQIDHAVKIHYEKYDQRVSFDKNSSVYLSNTNHEEDQPCHLQLEDLTIVERINKPLYDEPAQRYCPAGVYELVGDKQKLQINAQNCLHCKACDIKDPSQNIHWTPPEGGGGPNYPNM